MTTQLTRRTRTNGPAFNLFNEFFGEPFIPARLLTWNEGFDSDEGTLAVDVSEDEKHVIVRASLPGFDRKDIEVEIHDGVVSIKAEHSEEKVETDEKFYRKERRSGSYSRRFALPTGTVVEDGAAADLKDGILTIRIPKSEKASPRKISIK